MRKTSSSRVSSVTCFWSFDACSCSCLRLSVCNCNCALLLSSAWLIAVSKSRMRACALSNCFSSMTYCASVYLLGTIESSLLCRSAACSTSPSFSFCTLASSLSRWKSSFSRSLLSLSVSASLSLSFAISELSAFIFAWTCLFSFSAARLASAVPRS